MGDFRFLEVGGNTALSGSRALFIAHDIVEIVEDFRHLARYKGIQIALKHWENHQA